MSKEWKKRQEKNPSLKYRKQTDGHQMRGGWGTGEMGDGDLHRARVLKNTE